MAKSEQSPPFKMKIENGHLVPAAAWDAERLASYRNGSEVNCVITQEVASWRRRKYWSILGKVVKTCPVRQKRAEDLHKAIRLKLGIVESFTTMSGATKVELRSTSLMDEQEFEAYYHEAMDLLRDVTGVDVETLHKESADVGQDEHEQPEQSPPDDTGSGSSGEETPPAQGSAAADQSASGGPEEDGADTGATADEPSSDPRGPLVILNLKAEAVAKFLDPATDIKLVPDPKERRGALVMAAKAWKAEMPHHHDFLKTCFLTAEKVIKGEMPADQAREYLQGLVK